MILVQFWKTTKKGSVKDGTVTWDGTTIVGNPEGTEWAILRRPDLTRMDPEKDQDEITKAMEMAPHRFDGHYVRASYHADGKEPGKPQRPK